MPALFWIPVVLNRIVETGPWAALNTPKRQPEAAWADRWARAHANAVENLAVFAPLALAVQLANLNSPATAAACMVYFFARLVHAPAYAAGVPVIRTLAFATGFFCQMKLASTLLQFI